MLHLKPIHRKIPLKWLWRHLPAKSHSSGIPLKWLKVMFQNGWKSRLSHIPLKSYSTVSWGGGGSSQILRYLSNFLRYLRSPRFLAPQAIFYNSEYCNHVSQREIHSAVPRSPKIFACGASWYVLAPFICPLGPKHWRNLSFWRCLGP